MSEDLLSSSSPPSSVSRREFLTYAWVASLAAVAAGGVIASVRFATPPAQAGQFGGVIELGALSDLPSAGGPPLRYPEGRFWLIHTDEGLSAVGSTCTHLACQCAWDTLTAQFICPCHGSRFAADGARLDGPAPRGLDRFVVQLTDTNGRLLVETDASGAPLRLPADASEAVRVAVDTGRRIAGESS